MSFFVGLRKRVCLGALLVAWADASISERSSARLFVSAPANLSRMSPTRISARAAGERGTMRNTYSPLSMFN